MKPRTFARRPSSIGSNQLSKSRPSTSSARAVVILLIMAWSPARRSNAGIRVANPGDYATQFQPPPRQHRADYGCGLYRSPPERWGFGAHARHGTWRTEAITLVGASSAAKRTFRPGRCGVRSPDRSRKDPALDGNGGAG